MKKFEGKVALVTGAASGIGKAVFKNLADAGANVIMADLNTDGCAQVLEDYRKANSDAEVTIVGMNVTDKKTIEDDVKVIIDKYGRIDMVAHCAGVLTNGPLVDISEKDYDFVMNVNLKGTFLFLQVIGKQLLAQKGGKICVVASKAGKIGTPTLAHYAASKFGVIGLVQTAAMEWGREGVYINCVCPGEVDTEMLRKSYEKICKIQGISMEEMLKIGNDMSLVGRISPPEKVAASIAFLLSEDSDEIIGQAINIDGGIIFH